MNPVGLLAWLVVASAAPPDETAFGRPSHPSTVPLVLWDTAQLTLPPGARLVTNVGRGRAVTVELGDVVAFVRFAPKRDAAPDGVAPPLADIAYRRPDRQDIPVEGEHRAVWFQAAVDHHDAVLIVTGLGSRGEGRQVRRLVRSVAESLRTPFVPWLAASREDLAPTVSCIQGPSGHGDFTIRLEPGGAVRYRETLGGAIPDGPVTLASAQGSWNVVDGTLAVTWADGVTWLVPTADLGRVGLSECPPP